MLRRNVIEFPSVLLGRLWHTTPLHRYRRIRRDGAILVNPSMQDPKRWFGGNGPKNYPYVRSLGGVSLFDFPGDFDPEAYTKQYPCCSWRRFVPYSYSSSGRLWRVSVWIEILPERLGEQLISGAALLKRAKADPNSVHHNFMPGIEAAHIGDLSLTHFGEVFRRYPPIEEFRAIELTRLSDAALIERQNQLLNELKELEADAEKPDESGD